MNTDDSPPDEDMTDQDRGEIDEVEMYYIVRKAVTDALLDVVGTLVLVVLAFVLVWFGMVVAATGGVANPVQTAGGLFVVLAGLYFAGTALGYLPRIDELL